MRRNLLKDRAGSSEFALRRLVRVGSRTDGDVLAVDFFDGKVAPGERTGILTCPPFLVQS